MQTNDGSDQVRWPRNPVKVVTPSTRNVITRFGTLLWAVKNFQKRRSACSEGEKSAGVAVCRAAEGRARGGGGRDEVGEHGAGVYADLSGA